MEALTSGIGCGGETLVGRLGVSFSCPACQLSSSPITKKNKKNKHSVLSTFILWFNTVCDSESPEEEILHIRETFRHSGYSVTDVQDSQPQMDVTFIVVKPAGSF
jgi:hypothetical protein